MRVALLAATLAAQAAGAAPRPSDDWLVMLRWQAMPTAAAATDRHWTTKPATAAAAPPTDWPALRLRPGASASWRQDRWHLDTDTAAGWTPQGPVLYAAERRSPELQSLSLQALPSRRSAELNLAWSVSWPRPDANGGHEARGTLSLPPGRWVTVAEWAPTGACAAALNGERCWSTTSDAAAGWRLQVRAERP
ncbi:hypothetical protein KAK06_09625 [Ideonella sp. 4Y11]|uniref:Secreted protein n=1 Tax=Ideonella aquatica TaxID=2824119 RepID=A0A941BFX2_9BURK|nr:hypothetical protein [Ideonella aquatica]MBQ0959216.1 hypothetical protein [Ideonella aquatica]